MVQAARRRRIYTIDISFVSMICGKIKFNYVEFLASDQRFTWETDVISYQRLFSFSSEISFLKALYPCMYDMVTLGQHECQGKQGLLLGARSCSCLSKWLLGRLTTAFWWEEAIPLYKQGMGLCTDISVYAAVQLEIQNLIKLDKSKLSAVHFSLGAWLEQSHLPFLFPHLLLFRFIVSCGGFTVLHLP